MNQNKDTETNEFTDELTDKIRELEDELLFYKSIFNSHRGSVVFNLYRKKKCGKDIWIDKIRCNKEELLELDRDEDIEEWLKPIKCGR